MALLYSEASFKLGNVEGRGMDPADPRNLLMAADALAGAGVSVDFLDEPDLQAGLAQGYAALVLPGCTALEEASLPALGEYVQSGGTLLADGLCGYKDPGGWLRSAAEHPLNAVFGAAVADIQAIPERLTGETAGELRLPAWFLQIALEPRDGAEVLARFDEPDPRAAVTCAPLGQGRAWRLGTAFFQRYFHWPAPAAFVPLLAHLALPQEPVRLLNPSPALRLRRLDLPKGALLVLLNAGEATVTAVVQFPSLDVFWTLPIYNECNRSTPVFHTPSVISPCA